MKLDTLIEKRKEVSRIPRKTPKKSCSKPVYTRSLAEKLKKQAEEQKQQLLKQH